MGRTRLQHTTPGPHPLEQSPSTVESSINTVVLQWVWVLSCVQNDGGGTVDARLGGEESDQL